VIEDDARDIMFELLIHPVLERFVQGLKDAIEGPGMVLLVDHGEFSFEIVRRLRHLQRRMEKRSVREQNRKK
jgi:hypothetical protein